MTSNNTNTLEEHVDTFNVYADDNKMEVVQTGDDWFTLYIGDMEITQGDEYTIVKRVKQINSERGYDC